MGVADNANASSLENSTVFAFEFIKDFGINAWHCASPSSLGADGMIDSGNPSQLNLEWTVSVTENVPFELNVYRLCDD
ncbi:hypothetical protein CEXT_517881 [Caerostris extrusa]|uniref:Uncharacterized protein n=1 Tax=Caerostris extrusa TaxID=172846 RepID=A0AAV4SGC2_CAEEX|nr:hypothetical protein CEXT_517881 [Caerostris extrusa]